MWFFFFFFNDTATTEIYTLSLHDALPILADRNPQPRLALAEAVERLWERWRAGIAPSGARASLETSSGPVQIGRAPSELQSRLHLVCRLLLEKKKQFRPAQRLPRDPQAPR